MRCTHSQLIGSIQEFSHANTDSHFQQNDLSHSITRKYVSKLFQSRSWFSLRNSSNIFRFYFFFSFFFSYFFTLIFFVVFVFLICFSFFYVFVFFSVALLFCSYQAASLLICQKDTPVSVSLQAQLKKNFLQLPLPYVASNSVYQRLQMCHHPLVKIYSKSICDHN